MAVPMKYLRPEVQRDELAEAEGARSRFKRPPKALVSGVSIAPIPARLQSASKRKEPAAGEWQSIARVKKQLAQLEKERAVAKEEARKKSQKRSVVESTESVYSWLKRRGKIVKKFVDAQTRKDLRQVFHCLDSDGGGTVDVNEIQAALKVMGLKASKAEITKMIAEVDPKGDGELGFAQFVDLMVNHNKREGDGDSAEGGTSSSTLSSFPLLARSYHTRRDVAELIFRVLDGDGSGEIDEDELEEAFKHLGFHYSREEISELMKKVDDSGDGVLNFDEFVFLLADLEFASDPAPQFNMDE